MDYDILTFELDAGQKMPVVADVNNDGHQDLAVLNGTTHNMAIFLGDGQGNLKKHGSFSAGQNPHHAAAADINSDGFVDFVIANHETSYITLLHGDGLGNFQAAPNSPLITDVKPHPHVVVVQDLDADGYVDLIVDSRATGSLRVHRGLGQGAFGKTAVSINVGVDPYHGFTAADINGDGRIDVVTPNLNEIGVALNTGVRGLSFTLAGPVPATTPFFVVTGDLNGDGILDLITASEDTTQIEMLIGDGNASFYPVENLELHAARGAKQGAVGDINGDGVHDALIGTWSSDALIILGGDKFRWVRLPLNDIRNSWGLAIADLNEDDRGDLIIADGAGTQMAIYLSSNP